jgi:hypothetical protein
VASSGGQNGVCVLAIRDDRRVFVQLEPTGRVVDGTDAVANVASAAELGVGGSDEELAVGEITQVPLDEVVAAVLNEARDLQLVHGVDHRRRRAVSGERIGRVGDFRDSGAGAAESGRNERREQTFGAQRLDGLDRKAGISIHFHRPSGRDLRSDSLGRSPQIPVWVPIEAGHAERPAIGRTSDSSAALTTRTSIDESPDSAVWRPLAHP